MKYLADSRILGSARPQVLGFLRALGSPFLLSHEKCGLKPAIFRFVINKLYGRHEARTVRQEGNASISSYLVHLKLTKSYLFLACSTLLQ